MGKCQYLENPVVRVNALSKFRDYLKGKKMWIDKGIGIQKCQLMKLSKQYIIVFHFCHGTLKKNLSMPHVHIYLYIYGM